MDLNPVYFHTIFFLLYFYVFIYEYGKLFLILTIMCWLGFVFFPKQMCWVPLFYSLLLLPTSLLYGIYSRKWKFELQAQIYKHLISIRLLNNLHLLVLLFNNLKIYSTSYLLYGCFIYYICLCQNSKMHFYIYIRSFVSFLLEYIYKI